MAAKSYSILIEKDASIKKALKKLDKTAKKALLVVDGNKKLLGTLTDGDIRRHIIKTGKIEGDIKNIYKKNPVVIKKENFSEESAKNLMLQNKIELLPITDKNKIVTGFTTWNEIFGKEKKDCFEIKKTDIPVVIMAGGKGTRLAPFTDILPKPLIPIGNKSIIEHIISNFSAQGVQKFYMTLNYKGQMIEAYFKGIKKNYEIEFIYEDSFLGTAGSLKLLENKIKGDFFVSNCDILLKANFADALNFHTQNKASITSITSIQHYKIPYGVVNIKNGGYIESVVEKPEYTFQINTGVYILNNEALKFIPADKAFDMPQLIKRLIDENKKVCAYPENESNYLDIGQWDEYRKVVQKLSGDSRYV